MKKGIILNGGESIAVAKDNDLVYRIDPVQEIVTFEFGFIKKDNPIFVDLKSQIDTAYKVTGSRTDGSSDDDQEWETRRSAVIGAYEGLDLQIIEKGKIIGGYYIDYSGYDFNRQPLYLLPWQQIRVSARATIASFKLYCVPVVMNRPVNLLTEVLIDESNNEDTSSSSSNFSETDG